jgi:hypothetical protein
MEHVARMENMRKVYNILSGLSERDDLDDIFINDMIILTNICAR